jgi:hypothetical protein
MLTRVGADVEYAVDGEMIEEALEVLTFRELVKIPFGRDDGPRQFAERVSQLSLQSHGRTPARNWANASSEVKGGPRCLPFDIAEERRRAKLKAIARSFERPLQIGSSDTAGYERLDLAKPVFDATMNARLQRSAVRRRTDAKQAVDANEGPSRRQASGGPGSAERRKRHAA